MAREHAPVDQSTADPTPVLGIARPAEQPVLALAGGAPPIDAPSAVAEPVLPRLPDTQPHGVVDRAAVPGLRGERLGQGDGAAFIPPRLVSYGPSTTALALGRTFLVVAALLVGFASRRAVEQPEARDVFWPVAMAAGVVGLVGLVATAFWCVQFAENGRRLSARVSAPDAAGWTWALPVVWVALASITFLRIEVGGDFDPLPALAVFGLAVALAVPVSRLMKTFRGMTRRPPQLWVSVYVLDLVAAGAIWWRLMSWPTPVSVVDVDHARTTSIIAFAAAGVLTASALIYAFLAFRAMQSTYERLGRVEARHRSSTDIGPSWFHSGFRPDGAPSIVEARPLINLSPLSSAVTIGHVVLGALMVGWSVLVVRTGIEADGELSLFGEIGLAKTDLDRLSVLTTLLLVVTAAVIGLHGIWGLLAGLDASRATVHAGQAMSYAGAFVPAPLMIVGGLVVGDAVGEILVIFGVFVSVVAIVRLNLMLITLSSYIGGGTRGFGMWTWLLVVSYLIALAQRFLVAPETGRLGLLATLAAIQGAMVVAGGVVGRRAMRSFERAVERHPQVRRAREIRAARGV